MLGENKDMSNWSQNDANALLAEFAKIAEKVVDAKMAKVLKTAPAVVVSVLGDNITVLPVAFPLGEGQYITVKNWTDKTFQTNDTVWINYWGDYTNAYLSPASL